MPTKEIAGKPTVAQRAYMAGVIDSDGCIGINKAQRQCTRFAVRLEIQINNLNRELLELFQQYYGGSIYLETKHRISAIGTRFIYSKPIYHWLIADRAAEKCIRDIISYLIVKREKAKLAIELRETGKISNVPNRKNISEKTRKQHTLRNEKIVNERKQIYGRFKKLVS